MTLFIAFIDFNFHYRNNSFDDIIDQSRIYILFIFDVFIFIKIEHYNYKFNNSDYSFIFCIIRFCIKNYK